MPGRSAGLRKLESESLYYSCQVCSNHVGYFNKREQQGETGSLVPRLLLRVPFVTLLSSPLLFSGHPTYTHARLPSTTSVYVYIATWTVPVTMCVRVCVRSFSPMLKILGSDTNGNSYFLWRKSRSHDRRSRCSLSVSMHPSRSARFFDLVATSERREHASADIRSERFRWGGRGGMEMDRRLRAHGGGKESCPPVGIKGAREQFSICKKARFRNSRRRRAASFFSSSSSLSGKTGTRVLKRAFDANANLSS